MHKDLVNCFKTEDKTTLQESQHRVVMLVETQEKVIAELEYQIVSLKELVIKQAKRISEDWRY